MIYYTENEIKEEIEKGKIILLRENQVYDVTEFADRHPGGREYLAKQVGNDVTQQMKNETPHQHSLAAYTILKKYCVGSLMQKNGELRHRNGTVKSINGKTNGIANGVCHSNGAVHSNGHSVQHDNSNPDDPIDWNEPILFQVPKLGDRYFEWVHRPTDGHLRLMKSEVCEFFSQCPWYVVPLVWIPIVLLMLYTSYTNLQEEPCSFAVSITKDYNLSIPVSAYHMPLLFVIGFLLWTLDEYVIHRWLFHLCPPSNFPVIVILHFLFHGQHHKAPMDKMRLVFPPIPAAGLGVLVYSVYCLFMPCTMALTVFAGSISGYIVYDMIHYYLHHGTPYGSYFKSLKRYHVKHHYQDQQKGFGISSKMWDYPFGTLIKE
ncbi:fatty acid 2-hydroxylase-like isoform X2 [Ostrea edulis]|uniref:fatty acid 2-hydroxylase-like isoform X2 n=1 Tax=Ostrea edulis TaxID=37623 RepID=UPI0024AEF255|nr:fatty acid 2-hydroxylase-like isoform X2 [Ostrea edulis]